MSQDTNHLSLDQLMDLIEETIGSGRVVGDDEVMRLITTLRWWRRGHEQEDQVIETLGKIAKEDNNGQSNS